MRSERLTPKNADRYVEQLPYYAQGTMKVYLNYPQPHRLVYIIVVELRAPHSVYRKFGLSRIAFRELGIKVRFLV